MPYFYECFHGFCGFLSFGTSIAKRITNGHALRTIKSRQEQKLLAETGIFS